jgi:glycosyltransferase involved in cell wall biosynthesis
MRIGFDLSNIRIGGGVTHIVELLKVVQPGNYGIEQVPVWAGKQVLRLLPERPWLFRIHEPMLDKSLLARTFWQHRLLPERARECCDMLFHPGGSGGNVRPFVTMSQNLLPFEWKEMRRYGVSWMLFRLLLLRTIQARNIGEADGVIFLSEYARDSAMKKIKRFRGSSAIIPHGISRSFLREPRTQAPISTFSWERPFRFLYVSTIDVYKHPWNVAEAVAELRREGCPVVLDLVGSAYPDALSRLEKSIRRLDPAGDFIRYHGAALYDEIFRFYHEADAFIFASTCETFGQVLLEAMASGLPIACSDRRPMVDFLGNAGVYFDPENPREIAKSLRQLIDQTALRDRIAHRAFERAKEYSWERCAHETFSFLEQIAHKQRLGGQYEN